MVKINLQVIMIFIFAFIILLYAVDLYVPLVIVTSLKAGAYFFLASTIIAGAFAIIFSGDDKEKQRRK